MSFKIFRLEELNLDNFFFQSPRKVELLQSKNAILIPMIYKDEEARKILPILFQLPSIKLNDSYRHDDVLLVPINPINNNKTDIMKSVLNNIDNKLINDFKLNGKKWCKEVIQNLKNIEYKAIVNEIDDDDVIYENGVLSLSLLTNNNLKIYNEKKELIDKEDYGKVLIKGTIIQSIIELKGLMITLNDEDNEIFPLLKVHQIRYIEEKMLEVNLDNYSILDSDIEVVKQYTNTAKKNQMDLTLHHQFFF